MDPIKILEKEYCPVCGVLIEEFDEKCSNGHEIERCQLTLSVIDE